MVGFLGTSGHHFRLDQIQDGGRRLFKKNSNGHISETHYPILYTGHTLSSNSIVTVDAYNWSLDTYFTREGNCPTYGIKGKDEKADLEKYTRK